MEIKELFKKDFGVDLPISGGRGNSITSPVIIYPEGVVNDYVGVEYAFLNCLGIGRGIQWSIVGQELLLQGGRKIDKIKIKTVRQTSSDSVTQIENFYFDITDCT